MKITVSHLGAFSMESKKEYKQGGSVRSSKLIQEVRA